MSHAKTLEGKVNNFRQYQNAVTQDIARTQHASMQNQQQHTQILEQQLQKQLKDIRETAKRIREELESLLKDTEIEVYHSVWSIFGDPVANSC